jgi:hypothetical protein
MGREHALVAVERDSSRDYVGATPVLGVRGRLGCR